MIPDRLQNAEGESSIPSNQCWTIDGDNLPIEPVGTDHIDSDRLDRHDPRQVQDALAGKSAKGIKRLIASGPANLCRIIGSQWVRRYQLFRRLCFT
jgi:hypothetical protein